MSAAIFAPGWVWETQGKENFIENENRLEVVPVHIYTMYLSMCNHHTTVDSLYYASS